MTARLATVSYLNARPLVEGIEEHEGVEIVRRVPSALLETLESGDADIALCPVIDYQRSSTELVLVPVGAIGCRGPALTVRLFSSSPFHLIEEIDVDGESHTSVALLQIIMRDAFDRRPMIRRLPSSSPTASGQAVLLIGDKVISSPPDAARYPYELDLGAAWRRLTDQPFVFATWMARTDGDLGDLPRRLARLRRANGGRLDEIARTHASANGWPADLAVGYLSRNLRYDIGPAELRSIEIFWRYCHRLGLIDELRPMKMYSRES